jgi:hypothetical protein
MLVRVSCDGCDLRCLWTDEPRWFVDSVCLHPGDCRARFLEEEFTADPRDAAASGAGPGRPAKGPRALAG